MATLFKSYFCLHIGNKDSRIPDKKFSLPLDCPMEKTQPNQFCVGCQYLEVKTELI
jgi:hypothetical protein